MNPAKVTITEATIDQFLSVLTPYTKAYTEEAGIDPFNDKAYVDWLDGVPHQAFVAQYEDGYVGFGTVTLDTDRLTGNSVAIISTLYVVEPFRGTDVFSRLGAAMESWAREQKASTISFMTIYHPRYHPTAIRMMKKLGYTQHDLYHTKRLSDV